jgi:hypothetical protein
MKTFQYKKKINKKKSEVRKRKRVERSSDDPSSSIKRGEIPVCGSQQTKSDSLMLEKQISFIVNNPY